MASREFQPQYPLESHRAHRHKQEMGHSEGGRTKKSRRLEAPKKWIWKIDSVFDLPEMYCTVPTTEFCGSAEGPPRLALACGTQGLVKKQGKKTKRCGAVNKILPNRTETWNLPHNTLRQGRMTLPPMCDDFSASISMKGYNVQLCFEHINYALIGGSRYSKFSENLCQGKVR